MLAITQSQHGSPQQGATLQIERPRRLLRGETRDLGGSGFFRQAGEIDGSELRGRDGRDHLKRPAAGLAEGGAQRLVAAHDAQERAEQSGQVEQPGEPDGERDVVEGAAGLQAVEHPEALLGEREGGRRAHLPIDGGPARDGLPARRPHAALREELAEELLLLRGEPSETFHRAAAGAGRRA